MTYGPPMRIAHPDLELSLGPLRRDDMPQMVAGLSHMNVTKYTVSRFGVGYTNEDMYEFFEQLRKAEDGIAWGIYVGTGDQSQLIGLTDVFRISRNAVQTAITGSIIHDQSYWGRGVVSACHKARTWYMFRILGFDALRSIYFHTNVASGKALDRIGYVQTGLNRNGGWYRGQFMHDVVMACVNPDDPQWSRWWGDDEVPLDFTGARSRTLQALEWAEENVTLH